MPEAAEHLALDEAMTFYPRRDEAALPVDVRLSEGLGRTLQLAEDIFHGLVVALVLWAWAKRFLQLMECVRVCNLKQLPANSLPALAAAAGLKAPEYLVSALVPPVGVGFDSPRIAAVSQLKNLPISDGFNDLILHVAPVGSSGFCG